MKITDSRNHVITCEPGNYPDKPGWLFSAPQARITDKSEWLEALEKKQKALPKNVTLMRKKK